MGLADRNSYSVVALFFLVIASSSEASESCEENGPGTCESPLRQENFAKTVCLDVETATGQMRFEPETFKNAIVALKPFCEKGLDLCDDYVRYWLSVAHEAIGDMGEADRIRAELLLSMHHRLRNAAEMGLSQYDLVQIRDALHLLCPHVASHSSYFSTVKEAFSAGNMSCSEFLDMCTWSNPDGLFNLLAAEAAICDAIADCYDSTQRYARIKDLSRRLDGKSVAVFYTAYANSRSFARAVAKGERATPVTDYIPDSYFAGRIPNHKDDDWNIDLKGTSPRPGESKELVDENRCDIDRRMNLSLSELLEYARTGKPVLIGGLMSNWRGTELWRKTALLESSGDEEVAVIMSSDVASYGVSGDKEVSSGRRQRKLRLASFIEELYRAEHSGTCNNDGEEKDVQGDAVGGSTTPGACSSKEGDIPYLFTRKKFKPIMDGFEHLELFDEFPMSLAERERRAIFMIGADRSKTGFHFHSNAYNGLVFGKKHWYFMPPVSNLGPLIHNWFTAALPSTRYSGDYYSTTPHLERYGPLRCTQHAGEVMFVPTGWKHAVMNEGIAVAIAFEVGDLEN
mmetsp:Transcript_20303/g.33045  ORF Transcript_20303/g.33045 Transcript_20303/m.33045 type:complete len:570 (-) Transcript_20303:333-2042(-)